MPRILYTNPAGGGAGGVGTGSTGLNPTQAYVGPDGFVGQGLNNGTYAYTPDSAVLDIVGDLEITARIQPTSWTSSAYNQGIVGKRSTVGNYSYWLGLFGGKLTLQWSTDGTAVTTAAGLTVVPFTTESAWIRVTLDVDNGTGGNTTTYYTAPDSPTEPTLASWTQLGIPIVNAGSVTSIFAGTANVEFGSNLLGGNQIRGVLKRAIIRNSIGDIVCDADFDAAQEDCLAFTETSVNAAPVTFTGNRYTLGVPNTVFHTTNTQSMSGNQTHYMPFEVSAPISVDLFAVEATTAPGVAGTLRVGIFAADSNLQPTGTCVAQGAIPYTTTAGVYTKQITPVTLAPGMYLIAFNSTSSVTWRRFHGGITPMTMAMGNSPWATRIYSGSVTMSGDYTTGPLWLIQPAGYSTAPMIHCALLRWKAV